MTTQPIQSNAALDFINQLTAIIIKDGAQAAELWAKTQDPILESPFISWIFDDGVGYLASAISVAAQQTEDAIVLDIAQNWDQAKVVQAAKKIQSDGGTPNDQDLKNLENAEAGAVSFPGVGNISK